MIDVLKNRAHIYDGVRSNCKIKDDYEIYLDIKIKKTTYQKLIEATDKYIINTLNYFYKDKEFIYDDDYLIRYKNDILNLPNITPNGAFYPKTDNINEYNNLHKIFNDILIETKIDKEINSLAPLNFRVVNGECSKVDDRFYATTKLHSDSWNGHYGDAVIAIGVRGDETTSVEFNKPNGVSDKFFNVIEDFSDGLNLYKSCEHIKNLEFGSLVLFDHSCLHRTIKNNGGLRVSIDAGVIMNNSDGCRNVKDKERYEYMSMEDILKIGKSKFLKANETLVECYHKFKNYDYNKKPNSSILDNLKIDED